MTKQQEKKIKESITEHSKKVLSSKTESQKFLRELGVYTKNGQLTRDYK